MAANGDKDKTIPNLENATPAFLIDEIGKMRVESARLKFLDGIYKQALEARITESQSKGSEFIEGERYLGTFEEKTQERVDTNAVKQYFANDPNTLATLMKVISFKQLNTKVKP